MHQTLDEIRRQGLAALRDRLGRAGMIRFLQQFELGSGDYARERHAWVDTQSLESLRAATLGHRRARRASAKPRPRRPHAKRRLPSKP